MLNFPTSPNYGEQYTYGTKSWVWDGVAWNLVAVSSFDADNAAASATSASNSASAALASQTAAAGSAATVTAVNTTATNAASAASISASSAASSANSAIEAWAAATYPNETLAAISQTIHSGTVIASCIDEVTGDWVDQCQDKSWYKEALGGTAWLSTRCPDEATARAVIQSANMPELMANGTFVTDTSANWTAVTNASGIAVSGGALQFVSTGVAGSTVVRVNLPGVEAGKTYIASVDIRQTSGIVGKSLKSIVYSSAVVQLATNATAGTTTSSFQRVDIAFTATSTGYVLFYIGTYSTATAGDTYEIDSLSLKLVDTTVSAAGYVYQSTAAGTKFYSLTGTSGQTEVFRGIQRKYPRRALWVAEASRVVCYDLGAAGCPMWMVFLGNLGYLTGGVVFTSIAAMQGKLLIGGTPSYTTNGLTTIDFISEVTEWHRSSSSSQINNRIANRNTTAVIGASLTNIVSSTVNAVAITVLPNAPIDAATGLPVPTIAVGTAGGVSVIKDNGVVVNSSYTSAIQSVEFTVKGTLRIGYGSFAETKHVSTLTTAFAMIGASAGVVFGAVSYNNSSGYIGVSPLSTKIAFDSAGSTTGLLRTKRGDTAAQSMVAHITPTSNSGWQWGDIRGAFLSDVVAETVTGVTVLNETFATDVDAAGFAAAYPGWTAVNAAPSVVGGALRITAIANGHAYVGKSYATIVGKSYIVEGTLTVDASLGIPQLWVANTVGGGTITASYAVGSPVRITFIATATTTWVTSTVGVATLAGEYADFDNISVKLASPDRSVKNNGLILNGTLTKTSLGTAGNSLVAYSGFSAANYFEQPYSTNLDFGTGDFCVMGCGNLSTNPYTLFDRGSVGAGRIGLYASSVNLVVVCSATATPLDTGYARPSGLVHWAVVRSAGILSVWINNKVVYTAANTENVTNTLAAFRVGIRYSGDVPAYDSSLALVRISATAPSADQIAQIYRDELPLMQGADCVLAGTSAAITAMAYSDVTDILSVGTSGYRSDFKGLQRVNAVAGAVTTLAASGETIVTNNSVYQPAIKLRDELARRAEQAMAFGTQPEFFEFDTIGFTATTTNASTALTSVAVTSGTPYVGMGISGTGIVQGTVITAINGTTYTISSAATATGTAVPCGQTTFSLNTGWKPKAVYAAGTLKREGANKDYVVTTDGYRSTVQFAVSVGATAWVSIMAVKE